MRRVNAVLTSVQNALATSAISLITPETIDETMKQFNVQTLRGAGLSEDYRMLPDPSGSEFLRTGEMSWEYVPVSVHKRPDCLKKIGHKKAHEISKDMSLDEQMLFVRIPSVVCRYLCTLQSGRDPPVMP